MNLRKAPIVVLSACALLLSCNNDTKIDVATAKKYVEDNYKLTEAETVKSDKLTWDFKDTEEGLAKTAFDSTVKTFLKEDKEYSKSGSGGVKTEIVTLFSNFFLNSSRFDTVAEGLKTYGEVTWFKNKTGLKASAEKSQDNLKNTMQFQWNNKGGLSGTNILMEGKVNDSKVYGLITMSFNY